MEEKAKREGFIVKRKRYLALLLAVCILIGMTACGADSSPETGDTPPTENSQDWASGVIGLQEEVDISTFEKSMALWDTYADQAQPQPDGSLVLEFVFPSQNTARLWRFDKDNRLDVQLNQPSGDYWKNCYWLDGTVMGKMAKETNPDGTYTELDEMLNNPEGNHMIRITKAADGTCLNKVEMWNDSWSVCYYGQPLETLTSEAQVKEILKAAYSEVDISQQEYYTLSFLVSEEDRETDPYSYAHHADGSTQIMNVVDGDNYTQSTWVDGEMMQCTEQRTIGGYYYYYYGYDYGGLLTYTVEGTEGVANYPDGKQITFKLLPDETYGAVAYPLTEHRDGLDIHYYYVSDDSSYCHQATVTDHKTGDYLVFQLDSVRDPGKLDYFISVDWTHNGVTTHYDEDNNPLGTKVYEIPWFPSNEIGVPWVSLPL